MDLCLECSTWAKFFISSLTVSIMALFLNSILSDILINTPFMLLLSFVMSCMPSTKSLWRRFLLVYPLSATSLSKIISTNLLFLSGFQSSTSPGVTMWLSSSPFSLQIRCSLNPKNHPIEHFPRAAKPLNVLWIWMRWFLQMRRGVETTKLIPVHLPGRTFLMNRAIGMAASFSSSTKRL